jgi:hypothetical protein
MSYGGTRQSSGLCVNRRLEMTCHSWTYNNRDSVPSKPGIYILYQDSPMKKTYNIDNKGILYIGESSNLKSRLKVTEAKPQWKKWYEKNKNIMFNHSLLTFAVDFNNDFNLIVHNAVTGKGLLTANASLKLKYMISNNHENIESKLLKGHIMLFGQLPPFNIKGPTLRSIWESSDKNWINSRKFYKKIVNAL